MDFKLENPSPNVSERFAGLEDFFEVALQKQEVAVLERRNIRLVLSERALQTSGVLPAETSSQAKLPTVDYFIGGSVAFAGAHLDTAPVFDVKKEGMNGSSPRGSNKHNQRKRMNTNHERPRSLREIEMEVMAEGREWTRKRLQQRLQEEADQHGGVFPPESKLGGASAGAADADAD